MVSEWGRGDGPTCGRHGLALSAWLLCALLVAVSRESQVLGKEWSSGERIGSQLNVGVWWRVTPAAAGENLGSPMGRQQGQGLAPLRSWAVCTCLQATSGNRKCAVRDGASGTWTFTCYSMECTSSQGNGSSSKKASMKGPAVIQDELGLIEESMRVLKERAVLGRIEGISPLEQDLVDYVAEAIGETPEEVKLKGDNSFLITLRSVTDMEKLLRVHLAFRGNNAGLLEPWSSQENPDKTEFLKKYIWLQLPGLRDECIGMIARIVAAVGKLHILPPKEDFMVKYAKPRIGVRVDDIDNLPDSVIIKCSEDGVPKQIRQRLTIQIFRCTTGSAEASNICIEIVWR